MDSIRNFCTTCSTRTHAWYQSQSWEGCKASVSKWTSSALKTMLQCATRFEQKPVIQSIIRNMTQREVRWVLVDNKDRNNYMNLLGFCISKVLVAGEDGLNKFDYSVKALYLKPKSTETYVGAVGSDLEALKTQYAPNPEQFFVQA